MQYECPSCHLIWKDCSDDYQTIEYQICSFCGLPKSRSELLHWQLTHIENLNPEKEKKVFRDAFRFLEDRIEKLESEAKDAR